MRPSDENDFNRLFGWLGSVSATIGRLGWESATIRVRLGRLGLGLLIYIGCRGSGALE